MAESGGPGGSPRLAGDAISPLALLRRALIGPEPERTRHRSRPEAVHEHGGSDHEKADRHDLVGVPGTGSGAGAMTVTELRREAAKLGIEGRSKMGKAQLVRAVGQKRSYTLRPLPGTRLTLEPDDSDVTLPVVGGSSALGF